MSKVKMTPVLVTAMILGTALTATAGAAPAAPSHTKLYVNETGAPQFVSGTLSAKQGSSDEKAALEVLDRNKDFYQMKNPKADLKAKKTERDALGMTHVRLQQTKNGLPVEGAQVIVHFDSQNFVRSVNSHFNTDVDNATLDTTASLTPEAALAKAKQAVSSPDELEYEPTTELVVYPFENQNHVAYKVNVNFLGEAPGNWFVYVDAKTGTVIDQYNAIMDVDGHDHDLQPAKGSGLGVKGDHRTFNISHSNTPEDGTGSTFYLQDISIPNMAGILTYDFKNQWRSSTVRLPGDLFADKDAAWTDDYQRAAVDAHYNSKAVYEYYLKNFNRNSIDGNGMAIKSSVHYGVDYNNAFWNGEQMTYGDGDGSYFIPLSAALDVAAHEMAHGVTTHSAGLLYRNQSGALNESFSDIFGALVDSDDWEVGEDIMAPDAVATGRTSLRSLEDPHKYPVGASYKAYGDGFYPKHMSQYYDLPLNLDNGGVHINSSIFNHAAYLAGVNIGKEKLGQIYYRALTVYLAPTSTFKDARIAVIQSVTDLYGADGAEVKAVTDALDAVGMTEDMQ